MKSYLIFPLACLFCCPGVVQASETSPSHGCIEPVRLQAIEMNGFWRQQVKRLTEKWLSHCIRQMEEGGRGQELLEMVVKQLG